MKVWPGKSRFDQKLIQALHGICAYFTSGVFLLLTEIPVMILAIHLAMSYPCVIFLVRARSSGSLSLVVVLLYRNFVLCFVFKGCQRP